LSAGYAAIQWSRHKRVYDAVLALAVLAFLTAFVAVSRVVRPAPNDLSMPVLALRALGACAFMLLTIILCIGPAARLNPRFLPVLFNRRHLGVLTFLVALAHGALAVGYYHFFAPVNPFLSLLTSNPNYLSLRAFPFQTLGLGGLAVLFLMAATSHDFWLRNLSPVAWKRLHMLVYPAYALLGAHVALGALQTDRGRLAPAAVLASVLLVSCLHLTAALRESRRDRGIPVRPVPVPAGPPSPADIPDPWIDAGPACDIPPDRARTICAPGGERIALFRHNDHLSAVTNLCAHQGGPLGEGRIIDGCITCPWHGWQYRPADGRSPPPFTEQIATYRVRVVAGRAFVDPRPLPPGSPVAPVPCGVLADA